MTQQFRTILETAVQDADVLSETTSEAPMSGIMGMMGMLTTPPQSPCLRVQDKKRIDSALKCPICGCDTNTGKFCTECGAKLEPQLPEHTKAVWKCMKCGYDSNTGRFCSECGHKNKSDTV